MKIIVLNNGLLASVDDDDFERINQRKWRAYWHRYTKTFYARGKAKIDGKWRTVEMHREVMGFPKGKLVDHRNSKDTLNNCKSNLRLATRRQNCRNCVKRSDNRSGFKGVGWNKAAKKFQARISTKKGRRNLGWYDDPKDAALAYDRAALKYHKEFVQLNFPAEVMNG